MADAGKTASKVTTWISANWKGLAITGALIISTVAAITLYNKIFKKPPPGGNAPGVDNPKQNPADAAAASRMFDEVKARLPKPELFYKTLADSLQQYLQTNHFVWTSNIYKAYFEELNNDEFIALIYFWGYREYCGGFWQNSMTERYGSLIVAIQDRDTTSDFNLIKSKFSSTGLI